MKFSIVTPTRNNLEKLKSCVGSVRGQVGVESVEHIIQDALSTDGTGSWLEQQPDLLAVTEADASMYDAIERGWARCTGDVVSWLNGDEQYLPGTLEAVQDAFDRNPSVDFVYGNAIIVGPDGEPLAARREIPLRHLYVRNGSLYAYSCTLFFRRRLLVTGHLQFDKSLRFAADADMLLRLLRAKRPHERIDKYLSLFMLDGSNLSCSPQMLKEIALVQALHGGANFRWQRKFFLLGRVFERLMIGSFLRTKLSFKFAIDELPNYREIHTQSVGANFRIDHFASRSI